MPLNLLFFGELSPRTIHGSSISSTINLGMLGEVFQITRVEEFADLKYHSKFSLRKQLDFIKAYFRMLYELVLKRHQKFYGVFYFSLLGILKNLLVISSFKVRNPDGKVYLHIHRSDLKSFLSSYLNRFLFKLLTKLVSKFIVLSESQVLEMKELGLSNVVYLPNCIEYEANPNLESLPKPENFTILFLSNFLIKKGILDLLEAIKIVNSRETIPINFRLVGNYSNEIPKEKLDQLIAKFKFLTVCKPVFGNEKYSLIEQVDALILPSYIEGLPLTLLESLSRAKPILISPVGFIPEVLGSDYPFYIQPGNVQSIVNGIKSLVDNYTTNLKVDIYNRYQKFNRESHRRMLLSIFAE